MTRTGGGAMTPLEDRVRDAIRAKAAEVPPGAVPPLRLPPPVPLLSHDGGRERPGGRRRGPGPGAPGPRPSPPRPGWRPPWRWCSP